MIKAIETSDPTLSKNNFSFFGRVFLMLGYFPRGKAKAPKHVNPSEVILEDDLVAQIETGTSYIEAFANLNKLSFF